MSQPVEAPPPCKSAGSSGGVDNSVAWTPACAPLLVIVLDLALPALGFTIGPVAVLIAITANIVLARADLPRVRAAGVRLSSALAFFLTPVYLLRRSREFRKSYAMPVIWSVPLLMSVAATAATAGVPDAASQPTRATSTPMPASTRQVPSITAHDHTFIDVVRQGTTSFAGHTDASMVAEARRVCHSFDDGDDFGAAASSVAADSGIADGYDSGFLVGASVVAYCAPYTARVPTG